MTSPLLVGSLPVGAVFAGDYRVIRPLAAGGMGAVYVVEQLSTRKLRALKLMHPELGADESLRRRFAQEASVGAQIASEHVVEVQAAGLDAATGSPYLVMELLEGEHLGSVVERRGALTPAEVRVIMQQICHAVGAAHAAGIVHRDLKPQNVFLAHARRTDVAFTVKVLDFGIAKILSEQATQTAAVGSPLWLAPEQTQSGSVTPATDVWALGLIAYFLLTANSFWQSMAAPDASITKLLYEILLSPIPLASTRAAEQGSSLPAGFDAWFARCVQRDPAARFPDAAWAGQALHRILPNEAVSLVPVGAAPVQAAAIQAAGLGAALAGAPAQGSLMMPPSPWGSLDPSVGVSEASGGFGITGAAGANAPRPSGLWSGALIGCLVSLVSVLAVASAGAGYFVWRRSVARPSASVAIESPAAPSPSVAAPPVAPEESTEHASAPAESAKHARSGLAPTAPAATGAVNPGGAAAAPTTTAAPVAPGKGRGQVSTLLGGDRVSDLPADGQSVVRGLEPRFLACYERGIAGDTQKHFGESMIFWLTIGAGGELGQVQTRIDNAPPGVGTCVLGALRSARFSAPPKGAVPANLIVNFSTQ